MRICKKCGGTEIKVKYQKMTRVTLVSSREPSIDPLTCRTRCEQITEDIEREWLDCSCSCGFKWEVDCEDAKAE